VAEAFVELAFAQCGRTVSAGEEELSSWRHGELLLAGELDEITATMLLCPDCVAEDRAGEYEAGGAE
jgi:hypothetical protein